MARPARPPASVRLLTRDAFYRHLHARLALPPRLLSEVERETLARAAARDAVRAGAAPPFRLRPGLVRLMLGFHDDLARHGRSVDAFERLAVADLEPSVAVDRGARRLLDQTRFLVAAFRACAARVEATGALDEHRLRALLLAAVPARPLREVIVTVADRAAQPGGLYPADFDLAARLPELAHVTVIATDALLDSGFRQRLDDLLPGLDEERAASPARRPPALVAPSAAGATAAGASSAEPDRRHFVWRDREEELAWVAGRVGEAETPPAGSPSAAPPGPPACAAVVVQRPLPYLYLTSSVCADRGVAVAAPRRAAAGDRAVCGGGRPRPHLRPGRLRAGAAGRAAPRAAARLRGQRCAAGGGGRGPRPRARAAALHRRARRAPGTGPGVGGSRSS